MDNLPSGSLHWPMSPIECNPLGSSPEESLFHIGKVGEESALGTGVPRASTLFLNPSEVLSFSVNVSSGTHINSGAWIKHWEGN